MDDATKFTLNPKALCRALRMKDTYCLKGFTVRKLCLTVYDWFYFQTFFQFQRAIILEILRGLIEIKQRNVYWLQSYVMECNATSPNENATTGFDILEQFPLSDFIYFTTDSTFPEDELELLPRLTYSPTININLYSSEHETATELAIWQYGQLRKINQTLSPPRRFFRIGTVEVRRRSFKFVCSKIILTPSHRPCHGII